MTFTVGDKVRTVILDVDALSDFESDLLQDVLDGTIRGSALEKTMTAISEQKTMTVVLADDQDALECRCGRFLLPVTFTQADLELAPIRTRSKTPQNSDKDRA